MWLFLQFGQNFATGSDPENFATCKISQHCSWLRKSVFGFPFSTIHLLSFMSKPALCSILSSCYKYIYNWSSKILFKKKLYLKIIFILFYLFFKKKKNSQCEISQTAAPSFCFDHNFFIRTPFWVILVPLESSESVESKYS